MVVNERPLERWAHFAAEDAVLVRLRDGIEAGMEFWRYVFHRQYPDCRRQEPVDRALQVWQWNGIRKRERRHLRQRMHTCICAARARHHHGRALDPTHNLFQDALDRRQLGLYLPTME